MKRALAIVSAAVAMSGAGAYVTSFHTSSQGAQTAQQLTSHAPAGGWNAYLTRAVLSEAGTP